MKTKEGRNGEKAKKKMFVVPTLPLGEEDPIRRNEGGRSRKEKQG